MIVKPVQRVGVAAAAALSLLGAPFTDALAEPTPIYSDMDRMHPVYAAHGMVASQEARRDRRSASTS